jgi:uncharacterized protein YgbK (DUF1537 family)
LAAAGGGAAAPLQVLLDLRQHRAGNIGPVADALADELGADLAIACPAFPETGRTIYRGHLFVGDRLLSDTHMRDHPLTPMRESDLVRLLAAQTPRKVGLVRWDTIARGADAVRQAFADLRAEGYRYAITDALEDGHLRTLGEACADHVLITGGSGIALGLPDNFRARGLLEASGAAPDEVPAVGGLGAVLSGSCSAATQAQVAAMAGQRPALKIDPFDEAGRQVAAALEWAGPRLAGGRCWSTPPRARGGAGGAGAAGAGGRGGAGRGGDGRGRAGLSSAGCAASSWRAGRRRGRWCRRWACGR